MRDMKEEWKDIDGYKGIYQISNLGRVRSLDHEVIQKAKGESYAKRIYKGRILTPSRNGAHGTRVMLCKNGKYHGINIHRLVAEYFIPNPNGYDIVNHKNANPNDNRAVNLEWCTQSHNIKYAYDMGTKQSPLKRKVAQYDLDGNLIKIWDSVTEAAVATGTYTGAIANVCNGKLKKTAGYKWAYEM